MKKILLLFLFIATCILIPPVFSQGMSDIEVLKMAKEAYDSGMSQQQIALLLTQKGVPKEQLIRIYDEFDGDKASGGLGNLGSFKGNDDRTRQNESGSTVMDQGAGMQGLASGEVTLDSSVQSSGKMIFGHDIFNNPMLTFEPQLNIATPNNYVLGPGDEVFIDIWGDSEDLINKVITPDGYIMVDGIGPVHLNGLTVEQANKRVKTIFAESSYAGISSGTVSANLTLGQIRSITVSIMGEVQAPGTYTLSSLSSAFHALYQAGGVKEIGSLRSIKLYRKGKEIADMDIYEYIFEGGDFASILLRDGDILVVQPYQNLIGIEGKVKRPMIYETKNGETLDDILKYAGNFTGDAYTKNINVVRKSGREHQMYNVVENEFKAFALIDGDHVKVDAVLDKFENRVEIKGAVYREGFYALDQSVNTIKKLIEKAEGLRGDAFINRAVLQREQLDLTLEVVPVDISGLMNGTVEDIALKKNDMLYIPSIFDLQEEYFITVKGEVRNPGVLRYADNMTIEDVIIESGGLLESASVIKIDVARRIKNPKSTIVGDSRAETFTLALKDGYVVNAPTGFKLKPFDEIFVRRSPDYQKQKNVEIEGEVMFTGEYVIEKKGERLSDLVAKAGGLTSEAYLEGARLMRRTTPQEKELIRKALENLMLQDATNDTIKIDLNNIGEFYSVGIELDMALQNPRSNYDVTLKEGDKLIIPEYTETVKISGAVMHPNTVVHKEKLKVSHYIKQAGGFVDRARKNKVYVVYMNGTIARGKKAKVQPGCEVVVPMKPDKNGMGFAEIMGVTSSSASLAAVIASIVSMTK